MNDTYDAYMNLWWLEPGTALVLHSMAQDVGKVTFRSPSIDIGCGDGTFLFTALGGRLDPVTRAVTARPASVDYGTDIHQPSLEMATNLGFHKNILTQDNNDPFPFADDYFQTIYCNTLYWVHTPAKSLAEIRRMLHPEGTCLLHVMTPEIERPYEALKAFFDPASLDDMNRFKRYIPYLPFYYADWKQHILDAGFTITAERSVIPNFLSNALLNTGLRVVGEELSQVMGMLPPELLARIKQRWVLKMGDFLRPLLAAAPLYPIEEAPYIAFELKK